MNKVKDTNFGNKIFCEKNIKIGVLKTCKFSFKDSLLCRTECVCTTLVAVADVCRLPQERIFEAEVASLEDTLKFFSRNILYLDMEHYF